MELNYEKIDFSETNKEPKYLVCFIHGYGANGRDLLSLAYEFKDIIPNAIFISPNAPNLLANYPDSYYWFPLEHFTSDYLENSVNQAVPIFNQFLGKIQKQYNITNANSFIFGFSQGSMLALHSGLIQQENFKAIISCSGGCISKPKQNYINNNGPVIMTHGENDEILAVDYTLNSLIFLKEQQVNLAYKIIKEDGHYISSTALKFIRSEIKKKF